MSDEMYIEIKKSLLVGEVVTLDRDNQVKYLMNNIDKLNISERTKIGRILELNNKKEVLEKSAVGDIINLDLLDDNLINKMYNTMLYIISSQG